MKACRSKLAWMREATSDWPACKASAGARSRRRAAPRRTLAIAIVAPLPTGAASAAARAATGTAATAEAAAAGALTRAALAAWAAALATLAARAAAGAAAPWAAVVVAPARAELLGEALEHAVARREAQAVLHRLHRLGLAAQRLQAAGAVALDGGVVLAVRGGAGLAPERAVEVRERLLPARQTLVEAAAVIPVVHVA